MYFSFYNILPVVWISLAVACVAGLYLLIFYRRFIALGAAKAREAGGSDRADTDEAELPGVSVIVYVRENAEALRAMLPVVLGQEYPAGRFEVIVVNDGLEENVSDVVNMLSVAHRNLHITFVPPEAHNLSRRKLALSLGIKAARKEIVLLTTAEAMPPSAQWLRLMAEPFTRRGGNKEVVLGTARIDGLKGPMQVFDQGACTIAWVAAALRGNPCRGICFNLAYKRSLFFDAKGFSRSLTLQNGDDDIFIHQIANSANTSVVITPDTRVDVSYYDPKTLYRELRLTHCFTGRKLPHGWRRRIASGSLAAWVWLAAVATGVTFSLPNWFGAALLLLTVPAVWVPLTLTWRRTLATLGLHVPAALIWWCQLWRWLPAMRFNMRCNTSHRRNYTFELGK